MNGGPPQQGEKKRRGGLKRREEYVAKREASKPAREEKHSQIKKAKRLSPEGENEGKTAIGSALLGGGGGGRLVRGGNLSQGAGRVQIRGFLSTEG